MTENKSDVIIIGGGPAGISAALWCSELGMKTILLEREAEFGGQLLKIYNPITNYIGVETSNGREMRDIFLKSVEKHDFLRRLNAGVLDIDTVNKTVLYKVQKPDRKGGLSFAQEESPSLRSGFCTMTYSALIIATGVRRRKLGVEGEEEFQDNGIIDSGSKFRENAMGKTVVIIGGGDAALENALILGEFAAKVYVIHRSGTFRARDEFLEIAKEHPRIELHKNTIVRKFAGDPVSAGSKLPSFQRRGGRVSRMGRCDGFSSQTLKSVELENLQTGEIKILPVDIALIRIGVLPNTEMLREKVDLDKNGYVLVNANCETSVEGVFAIGDTANPKAPTISTAAGTGSTAAKAAFALLNKRQDV